MFRNYLAAALGNLSRNWVYASITILGLAVSFAAAILIGLYLNDEYSFDRFIPDYQRIYRIETDIEVPGSQPWKLAQTSNRVGPALKLDFPQIQHVARITPMPWSIKQGATRFQELVLWADPDFFRVMRFPVLAGDPDAALASPDGLVITRSIARKYFGEDAPIGKTLTLSTLAPMRPAPGMPPEATDVFNGDHPMRIMAVLNDLLPNSHLIAQIYAPGGAAFSPLAFEDKYPSPFSTDTLTYFKLKPGADIGTIRRQLGTFADRLFPKRDIYYHVSPLSDLHFSAKQYGSTGMAGVTAPPGDEEVDAGLAAVGALVVLIAAINFVTLMTARASRRAVEVGVRKAVGASRRDLIAQFMGEALIYVFIATVVAVALAELILPHFNAFVGRNLTFDYLGDPHLFATILAVALLTALLAGIYPALMLSSFRPAATLKGGAVQPAGSASVRQALVLAQFAILIGLIVMTGTIYRQTNFALHGTLLLDNSQVVMLPGGCRSAFEQEVSHLPGVEAVSCAGVPALGAAQSRTGITVPGRKTLFAQQAPVDAGFFELHGLKPLAGRFFSRTKGEDMMLAKPGAPPTVQPPVVINETAARQLGFSHPADAIGKNLSWYRWSAAKSQGALPPSYPSRVIGVVPDFTLLSSVRDPIEPTLYFVEPASAPLILAKLKGRSIPETLDAMKRLWKQTGNSQPFDSNFESEAVRHLYDDIVTQGIALAICAGLAICIACLGLFALAAFVTERRTKEIGVRKAMGAETSDIVRLLLWQFTKPVLLANLVAWPLAFWAMDHWLHGFAYRVGLPLWLFIAASGAAVLIAWATVSVHAFLVARAKPVAALRYE
jgi:putative ABC transport system permease protein